MSWFKKLKKSRKTSQQPASSELPPHIGFVSEGVDNREGSRTILQDDSRDRRPHTSGASTLTPGQTDSVTSVHEQEREQEVPSNAPGKPLGQNVPNLSFAERGSEAQQTVVGKTAEMTLEHGPEDGSLGQDAQDSPQESKETGIESFAIPVGEEATRGFGPLRTVLSSIHTHFKGTIAVGRKIEGLISRLAALEQHFNSRPSDVADLRLRDEVIRKLQEIEEQWRLLLKSLKSKEPTDGLHVGGDVSKLLEDIQEAVFDYQMEQQSKIYIQECKRINPAETAFLNNFRSAQETEFRHGDRNGCLKGTRGTVLDEIEHWTRDFTKPPVYWLNGLAGTGKSTITQTIAERTFADGQLGASFFCSRDFEDRRNLRLIFPTLAVQLARKYSDFRSLFIPLVQSDPGVASESLYNQLRKLIVEPLKESDISTVIIIDALDECKDEEPASAILSVLGQFVSEIPKAKFLVTGRPEPRIQEGFRLPLLVEATHVFVLHEVEPNEVDGDIWLFFSHKFSEIARRRRGLDGWPTREQLNTLCGRAGGLFVYAVATVKFVDKLSGNPRKQLDLLLQTPWSTVREARTKFKADTTLDSLYTSILQGAFGDEDDPDDDPKVRSVLGAMFLAANPLSPSTIAMLLGFDSEDVFPLLSSIQSLLILREDINHPVQPFHKSFPDFIMDPDRRTNRRFHVSPPDHHSQLLLGCFDLMDRTLGKNMCGLPEAVVNSDIDDLAGRIEQYIDPALRYACRSWQTHLGFQHTPLVKRREITSALHRFLEEKFIFWLEVLSVLGAVRNAVDALQVATDWLQELPTLDLANDCRHFVTGYFDIICTSSQHIYHSALVLAPETSIVRKLYGSHSQQFARIVRGVPTSWDSNIAATTSPFRIGTAVWSPCNRFIAISPWDTVRAEILDSVTLQRLQSLRPPQDRLGCRAVLLFSPDSCRLTYSGWSAMRPPPASRLYLCQEILVVTWDLQTGGVVSAMVLEKSNNELRKEPCITYSMDGRRVAIFSQFQSGGVAISIFDVISGVYMYDVGHPQLSHSHLYYHICTHGEFIQFATCEPTGMTIWEVGFERGAPIAEAKTLTIPDNVDNVEHFEFIPALHQAIFIYSKQMLVWDVQGSKSLLHHSDIDPHPLMTFSSDGCFLACVTNGSGIYLWKKSPTGYMLHGKLLPSGKDPIPLLSPNGGSIIIFGGSMVRLWHTSNFTTTSSDTSIQPPQQTERFILDFLPDRSLAVVTRKGEKTVIILDFKSGVPQLIIETSMEVYGLRVTQNTIVAMGCNKVITWNLPEEHHLPSAGLNIQDNIQIIHLSDLPTIISADNVATALVFFNFHYVALIPESSELGLGYLCLYNASTGQYLSHTETTLQGFLRFALGGENELYVVSRNRAEVWKVTGNHLNLTMVVDDFEYGSWRCPWGSSCGYQVTKDGWILGLDGKRHLMLPPPWQSDVALQVWNKQFLVLLHATLPELVIIEFGS